VAAAGAARPLAPELAALRSALRSRASHGVGAGR